MSSFTSPLLKPNLYLERLEDVDFRQLAQKGIVHYCLDVDNTILTHDSNEVPPSLCDLIDTARSKGYIKSICLISNVILGIGRTQRLAYIAEQLGIPHYYPALLFQRKPNPKPFLWAMEVMRSEPATTAVIGDQIFSDILGGNRLGMYTILIKPKGKDHWTTRLSGKRQRERQILARLYPSRLDDIT